MIILYSLHSKSLGLYENVIFEEIKCQWHIYVENVVGDSIVQLTLGNVIFLFELLFLLILLKEWMKNEDVK